MDRSGPLPAAGFPPPAPPPPPSTLGGSPKVLVAGGRPPKDREHFGSIRPAQPTERPIPFAGVHPETLQHAAARLRPTQHRESLFPHEREQFLDGPDQLAAGRHWPDQPKHAPLAEHKAGAALYAPPADPLQSSPFRVHAGHPLPLSNQQQQQMGGRQVVQVPIQLVGPLPGQTFGPGPIAASAPFPPSQQLITDPKRFIHAYATQTPVATLMEEQQQQSQGNNQRRTNGRTGAGSSNYDFARELRDQGLTDRQRTANRQKSPQNVLVGSAGSQPPSSLHNYAFQRQPHQTFSSSSASPKEQQVDELIREMEWKMRTGYGAAGQDYCTKCRQQISGDPPGVTALGQPYHVTCFCCDHCQKQLAGCSFYSVDGKNLCQVDYMNSLEKCDKCKMPITQKILRALGKAFHPECFVCPSCQKSLDGIPFTVDKENQAFCLDCFHERFSPRCAACLKVIAPAGNETEVARVIAMDRSYHLDCYKCEDCGLKLNSKIEGQGCYPLESHLFCKNCNLKRLKSLK